MFIILYHYAVLFVVMAQASITVAENAQNVSVCAVVDEESLPFQGIATILMYTNFSLSAGKTNEILTRLVLNYSTIVLQCRFI